jgi:hypothetical protein
MHVKGNAWLARGEAIRFPSRNEISLSLRERVGVRVKASSVLAHRIDS